MTNYPRIPLVAVIGHPVAHSRSPALHGHWLKRYRLPGHYIPIDIAPADFETRLRQLPGFGFVGANVTIPHKQSALAIADRCTDRARQIGAANTLTFGKDGAIHADNTDGYGFITNLQTGAPNWSPHSGLALVLGAGGAARAILQSLRDAGQDRIILANRTRSRADDLAQDFAPNVSVADWGDISETLKTATLLVNTTSLGMDGMPPLDIDVGPLSASCTVTDIVYVPLETSLLRDARAKGCRTVDGLGMLLHQAAPGFEAWFGRAPEVDDALRAAVLGR